MMRHLGTTRFIALLSTLFVAFTLVSVDYADARRGGSFGSRGGRTWQAPAPTRTAPNQTGPVERTMTPNPGTNQVTRQQQTVGQQRPGLFNGLGGSLMRGILIGGVIGMLLGYGFGGLAGALGFVLQLLLFAFIASMVMGWLRSRREPAVAGGPGPAKDGSTSTGFDIGRGMSREAAPGPQGGGCAGGFAIPSVGQAKSTPVSEQEITMTQDDLDTFERRLGDVQRAFADEDHAALRRVSTPEMVSFFSEELADNAKRGVRNDVSGVRLVQADIAEAWREDDTDYATAAFEYESVDVMRDRQTGAIVEGDDEPTATVELWTFVRRRGDDWKLSAIQEA